MYCTCETRTSVTRTNYGVSFRWTELQYSLKPNQTRGLYIYRKQHLSKKLFYMFTFNERHWNTIKQVFHLRLLKYGRISKILNVILSTWFNHIFCRLHMHMHLFLPNCDDNIACNLFFHVKT